MKEIIYIGMTVLVIVLPGFEEMVIRKQSSDGVFIKNLNNIEMTALFYING
jgi:hypothetical protein